MNKQNPVTRAYRNLLATRLRIGRKYSQIDPNYKFKGTLPKKSWDLWELRAK